MNNRLHNCKNPHQGAHKKVLCVCSAGLLRSPTAAVVLSAPPFNHNTMAAGLTRDFALVPVDLVLLEWADEIVCMEPEMAEAIRSKLPHNEKPVICLNIEDSYPYRDPTLMALIAERYVAQTEGA